VGARPEAGRRDERKGFIGELFERVPCWTRAPADPTTTFAEREIGDVLVAWGNEARCSREGRQGPFEIVVPPTASSPSPPVALIDRVVDKRGTRAVAQAYLEFHFTPEAQAIAAKHFYRPNAGPSGAAGRESKLTTVDAFGGWSAAQQAHFSDGGLFDQLYAPAGR
jgi:sulfate transport system substrate-binding protein